jgi:hypothetical protein
MMKGEDTEESWCKWSCQAERHRSSKHRNRGGGLRGVYHNFLFLWIHFEVSQIKEDATAYERRRHLRQKVCGPQYEPKFRPPYDDERRHLRQKVCGPQYMPKFRLPHDDKRRHLREGVRAMK